MSKPIALLTDFGLKDHYVGSLKGVILGINPKAVIMDITHDIRPQNIKEAAFVLNAVYDTLPKRVVIVAVVDPGVGSKRRTICIKTSRGFLVGPDNGIFSFVLARETKIEARLITNDRFFRKPVSSTFHGRDIFSPVGAHLATRDIFDKLGPRIHHLYHFPMPAVKKAVGSIQGEVIYVDRFGNAITNLRKEDIPASRNFNIDIKGLRAVTAHFVPFFSAGLKGELIALWNSNGFLELAVREESAETKFNLKVGSSVIVKAKR